MANQLVRALVVTNDWEGAINGGFIRWPEQPAPDNTHDILGARFQLGEFIRVLRETDWEGFDLEITRAHRTMPHPASAEERLMRDRCADVVGFRFDKAFKVNGEERQLSDYDMALFFAISPDLSEDENPEELRKEGEAVALFMENGGGFFATGDHENYGSALSQFIPRVRSMRRWHYEQPGPNGEPVAPSALGTDRNDTLQPDRDGKFIFENQSDDIPQPIQPVWYEDSHDCKCGCGVAGKYPHPLLLPGRAGHLSPRPYARGYLRGAEQYRRAHIHGGRQDLSGIPVLPVNRRATGAGSDSHGKSTGWASVTCA